ncbi:hypothetical protein GCM10010363_73110 [Streptomyces omiyaensis]|nr:hypothetical protein GCM10010363_73110 [Streptomyces omiyaensis]
MQSHALDLPPTPGPHAHTPARAKVFRAARGASQHLLDLLGPQVEPGDGGGGQSRVGPGAREEPPEDGGVAGLPLLGVRLPPEGEEFGEAADRVRPFAVAGHPLFGAVPAGRRGELVDRAEVVEDQHLVHSRGGGHGTGRGPVDALLDERARGAVQGPVPGVLGAHVLASSRTGAAPAGPRAPVPTWSEQR